LESVITNFWSNESLLNSKSQISNIKQITMTEIRNFKHVWVIEIWHLRFICDLVLGIWDFQYCHLPDTAVIAPNPTLYLLI